MGLLTGYKCLKYTVMKKIRIASYQIGLVFKSNELVDILTAGTHIVWGNKKIEVLKSKGTFKSAILSNDLLLENHQLSEWVEQIQVRDGELVLLFEEGIFLEVLPVGKYAYWKEQLKRTFLRVSLADLYVDAAINKVILESPKLKSYIRKLTVPHQNTGLLFVDGKFSELLEAGTYYYWQNNTLLEIKTVDTRVQQMEISGQELLSRDKATLRVSFFIQYEVVDLMKAVTVNKEYEKQLYLMVQFALRSFIGALSLDELLGRKDSLGQALVEPLAAKAASLGVRILSAGIRDVILTGEMKDIMNRVLVAEKRAEANSITRREETASTRSMLNTAKMMENNSILWKLKEMEYIERIADKIGTLSLSGNGNLIGQLKEIFVK